MKKLTGQDRSITSKWRPATQAVRAGTVRSHFGETSEALFLTSGYAYDCAGDAAARFAGEQKGMTYSRLQNPTVEMLEERLALMEGAEAARCMASGMAAMTAALLCQLSQGDHIVAARAAFGSCRWLTDSLLPRFGIEATIVDGRDNDAWKRAIKPNTKLFFFETPANPTLDIVDLEAVCGIAKDAGVLTVVDNAFATPLLQRPMDYGADIVAYSATKMMDGQGRVLAGAVCGTDAFINNTLLAFTRNTGPTLSAFNAWVVMKGARDARPADQPPERECAEGRAIPGKPGVAHAVPGPRQPSPACVGDEADVGRRHDHLDLPRWRADAGAWVARCAGTGRHFEQYR